MNTKGWEAYFVKLEAENASFLYGECPVFAIALNRVSGLPIYAVLDTEDDVTVLAHAYVRYDEDTVIDAAGPHSYEDMLNNYETWEPEEVRIEDEKELLKIGLGTRKCPSLRTALPIAKAVWEKTQEFLAARKGL